MEKVKAIEIKKIFYFLIVNNISSIMGYEDHYDAEVQNIKCWSYFIRPNFFASNNFVVSDDFIVDVKTRMPRLSSRSNDTDQNFKKNG